MESWERKFIIKQWSQSQGIHDLGCYLHSFFPLGIFQSRKKNAFNFMLVIIFLKNTQRNTFVVVAIKFPEQNTFGAAAYSPHDQMVAPFSPTFSGRGCFLMTSNHLPEWQQHTPVIKKAHWRSSEISFSCKENKKYEAVNAERPVFKSIGQPEEMNKTEDATRTQLINRCFLYDLFLLTITEALTLDWPRHLHLCGQELLNVSGQHHGLSEVEPWKAFVMMLLFT